MTVVCTAVQFATIVSMFFRKFRRRPRKTDTQTHTQTDN